MSICNAILRFKGTEHFVMCEHDKNHEGRHRGLCWEWNEMDEIAHDSYRLRGYNVLNASMGLYK